MSDLGKEKRKEDNPVKISEILADFFLQKMGTSYASDDSDHLHKRKKKKSKHKKKKHKKSKHRHRGSTSESTSRLNLKSVDDVSSSEEIGIKRLKKIKSIKLQSTTNLALDSVLSVTDNSKTTNTNAQPSSSDDQPAFYGPSLELLLFGAKNKFEIDSNPKISEKDCDDKQLSENETKSDLKETKCSFQKNSTENFVQGAEDGKSSTVSSEYSGLNCDISNEINSMHSAEISNVSDFKSIKENGLNCDVKKNDSQNIFEEKKLKVNMNLNESKIDVKMNEPKSDAMKIDIKIDTTENEDSEANINGNMPKICLDESNVVKEKESVITKGSGSVKTPVLINCKSTESDSSNYLTTVTEINKKESTENCMSSLSMSDEKIKSDSNQEKSEGKIKSDSNKKKSDEKIKSASNQEKSEEKIKSDSNKKKSDEKIKNGIDQKKDTNDHFVRKLKKNKNNIRKHSKSHSRSPSPKKSTSSRSKHKKHRSRSLSQDSSNRKKRKHSRSRSYSRGRKRSNDHRRRSYTRSYSRSRSRSRHRRSGRSHSQSPSSKRYKRKCSRSRSKESYRLKTHKHDESREHHHSSSKYRTKSRSRIQLSRSKSRSKSKSRHKSLSPKKSRSRSKSKEKKSSSEKNNKIDQAKILETARRNVLQMIKKGTLPEGLPMNNLKKEQLLSIQAGGKSVQELTDFCQRLSKQENEQEASDGEDKDDKAEDDTGFIHHPFKIKEPGVIKLNIKNAVQLPIKTHAQKVAETARLSSQFPVSSGNKHRQKELEWIPVVPESSKTDTKSSAKTVSTIVEASTSVVPLPVESTALPVPPPPPLPPPAPIVYPCPPPTEIVPVSTPTSVTHVIPSAMPLISIPPPPLPLSLPPPSPPVIQSSAIYQAPHQPMIVSYTMPNQEMMSFSTVSPSIPSISVFKQPKRLDISSIVTKRFQALQKLNENPNDFDALRVIQEAEQSIQDWVESQQVPGLFTGSTDVKVLTANELCGPFNYRNRKDILMHAPPVTEGKGMSLLKKMGWNPGEGLGKNKEGSLEPLVLDIKTDKKGLVSEGENSKKGVSSFLKDLQGKHPVSALMELCSKRKWKTPLYTCVKDEGPSHKKLFLFKVEVNGVEYQPLNPCSNKKVAKADAAVLCLQSLNVLPKTA